jgi:hypothetical protein
MCVVSVLAILRNVRKAQEIKLLSGTASRCIHWEQDREGYARANEADDCQHLDKPEVEIAIERLVVENIFIREATERLEPVELP